MSVSYRKRLYLTPEPVGRRTAHLGYRERHDCDEVDIYITSHGAQLRPGCEQLVLAPSTPQGWKWITYDGPVTLIPWHRIHSIEMEEVETDV